MSKNRRKKLYKTTPANEEQPLSARIVAIPKIEEPKEVMPEPEVVPEVDVQFPEEPEPSKPEPAPVVILQVPMQDNETHVGPEAKIEPKTEPKPAKAKAKSDRIGDVLRGARLERGDDLYLIAEYLCIKPSFLIALENSRYDEFPADAYVIGFLRTYANFLGIDGKEAVDRYRYEMAGRRKKPILMMPTPVTEGRMPSGILMAGAAVAFLLIYALWYGFSSTDRRAVHVPPPLPTAMQPVPSTSSTDMSAAAGLTAPVASASQAPAPTPVAPQPQAAAPSEPTPVSQGIVIPPASPGIVVTGTSNDAVKDDSLDKLAGNSKANAKADLKTANAKPIDLKPEAKTPDAASDPKAQKTQVFGDPDTVSRVIIRALQSSWVMVVDDTGKTVFDHVLKPGETFKVPNKSGLTLTTGNGAGIVLTLDGKDLPKVASGAPHVVRNITLDPDRLAADAGSYR